MRHPGIDYLNRSRDEGLTVELVTVAGVVVGVVQDIGGDNGGFGAWPQWITLKTQSPESGEMNVICVGASHVIAVGLVFETKTEA